MQLTVDMQLNTDIEVRESFEASLHQKIYSRRRRIKKKGPSQFIVFEKLQG